MYKRVWFCRFTTNDPQIVLPAAARMLAAQQRTKQKPPVFSGG
jgi:hypothetical protein